jgi:hypothetical protein
MRVALRNRQTSAIVQQKIGWSWTCFFLGWAWGIPLFYKKLYGLGTFILVIEWISYGLNQPNLELKPSPIARLALDFLPFVISTSLAGFVKKKSRAENIFEMVGSSPRLTPRQPRWRYNNGASGLHLRMLFVLRVIVSLLLSAWYRV